VLNFVFNLSAFKLVAASQLLLPVLWELKHKFKLLWINSNLPGNSRNRNKFENSTRQSSSDASDGQYPWFVSRSVVVGKQSRGIAQNWSKFQIKYSCLKSKVYLIQILFKRNFQAFQLSTFRKHVADDCQNMGRKVHLRKIQRAPFCVAKNK
jgi:hypothetical protein